MKCAIRSLWLVPALWTASLQAATFGTVVTLVGGASDLVLDEPRGRLYLVNPASSRVEIYNTRLGRYSNPVRTDTRPLAAAIGPDGRFLYVVCYDQSSLNIIDLELLEIVKRVNLPAAPEGVAAGIDGRVLISTIGSGAGNAENTLLLYDGAAAVGRELIPIAVTVAGPTTPGVPPAGRPAYAVQGALLTSSDGSMIFGVNNLGGNRRLVFVYEVASASVLRSRFVASVSNVMSAAPDGSKVMVGLSLFETESLLVLAQQNSANAPFTFSNLPTANFNLQQNQGGSVFAPDGQTIYSAFNIAPIQNPPARPNVSQLLLNDPDNLLINSAVQLPENLAGKMVITNDSQTIYALSESGFVIIPIGRLNQSPFAVPTQTTVALTYDQCAIYADRRTAQIQVLNAGRGRLNATAQLLQGAAITPVPPVVAPRAAFPPPPTGTIPGGAAGLAATVPALQLQPAASGTNMRFTFNTQAARAPGTVVPHTFVIQSNEAVNIPPNVRVFQNNRNSESFGQLIPVDTNANDAERLWDMILDEPRQRIYIANSGKNRIEVFDLRSRVLLDPIEVGQLPHSMTLAGDGVTLYAANIGGEYLSVVDLNKMQQVGRVRFPPLPLNSAVAITTPLQVAWSQRGPQVLASNNTLWRVVGDEVLPRVFNSSVFGTTTPTIAGPNQTMASTPGGEYVILLAGNGTVYLYDASVDDWIAGRQVFGAATPPGTRPPLQGYYGPISAGPRGQYFVVNNTVLNPSLTPQTAATTTRPAASLIALNATTYARFSTPPITNLNQLPALTVTPAVEIVNVNTGQVTRTASALEGPLAIAVGNVLQRVPGRTMALDAQAANAYVLTSTGLSIVPMTQIQPAGERPAISPNGIVNAANYRASIAQNSIISIFGSNLGDSAVAGGYPLPASLGGICVTLNNAPIPLLMSSPGQINAQMPPNFPTGRYNVVVRNVGRLNASTATSLTVARYAPAVFTDQNGQALVFDLQGRQVTPSNPAKRDQQYVLYATGLGLTTGGAVEAGVGSPSSPLAESEEIKLYFGDKRYVQSEMIVEWSGLAPGLVGVYQINLRVPGFRMRGDDLVVTLSIGGIDSATTGTVVPKTAVE